jgi:hypothetical protein
MHAMPCHVVHARAQELEKLREETKKLQEQLIQVMPRQFMPLHAMPAMVMCPQMC